MTFFVRFATMSFAPPHSVSMLSPANGWENIDGSYADGRWTFVLDDAELWAGSGYFKFLLDDRFWMDDPYIRISPETGAEYTFDEGTVSFGMSTTDPTVTPATTGLATPPPPVAPLSTTVPAAPPAVPTTFAIPTVSEGAIINRVVLLATPFLTIAAAWVAGVIARHVPGVTLDQTQVVSFMIAIVAICLAGAWKWLAGWQQHELLVAHKLAAPLKAVISTTTATTITTKPEA